MDFFGSHIVDAHRLLNLLVLAVVMLPPLFVGLVIRGRSIRKGFSLKTAMLGAGVFLAILGFVAKYIVNIWTDRQGVLWIPYLFPIFVLGFIFALLMWVTLREKLHD